MNSFNHYAYGAIGDWMVHVVAGLDLDEAHPGYRHSSCTRGPAAASRRRAPS